MNNDARPIPAPVGASVWTARHGFLFRGDELIEDLSDEPLTLIVSDDSQVRGVGPNDKAPLAAVVRLDRELWEAHALLDDLTALHAKLAARVSDLGDQQQAQDTDRGALAVELAALRGRIAQLENRRRP